MHPLRPMKVSLQPKEISCMEPGQLNLVIINDVLGEENTFSDITVIVNILYSNVYTRESSSLLRVMSWKSV